MPVKIVTDQLGQPLEIPFPPKRIISLVPSQTELLFDLGLADEVVGITKFCVHPSAWRKTKTIIGGTKKFNFDTIEQLKPDLIIGNKEENYKEGIEALQQKYPVWMSDIVTLTDAFAMIQSIGEITGRLTQAETLVSMVKSSFQELTKITSTRVLYLIWRNPWMGAGAGTFIHEMLTVAGFENCLQNRERYPEFSSSEIAALKPDLVFLSSEPYPFTEKHITGVQVLLPEANIICVDGEMFSWYGSRMRYFASYITKLPIT
ncbi:MAG: ABC transporter substrate-binding protein [Cyclobacteriaceae bacterium]|nr:ABC transporter substrate-binding protein [Cyclobacteriaceae bacterium]